MTNRVLHKASFAAWRWCALTGSASAGWRDQITNYDADRLTRLEDVRAAAVQEAQQQGGTGDVRAIRNIRPRSPWRARTGAAGHMALPPDETGRHDRLCRVQPGFPAPSAASMGASGSKAGTQRMAGYLYPVDGGLWVYLGAQSAKGEPWHRYSGRFASVGAETTPDDQVGALVGIGRNALRIDLPQPSTQSRTSIRSNWFVKRLATSYAVARTLCSPLRRVGKPVEQIVAVHRPR